VEVSSESTWLVGGAGKREQIESRAAGIRHQISVAAADFEKEKLQERLAKLVGATAVIHVGGASIVDREERKYRIQTAFHSIRSAMAGGTLPGGGTALWRASRELRNKYPTPGGNIVADALAAPLLAQIKNARGSHEEVIREMESPSEFGKGFDALKRVVSDLPQSGILDSTNVVLRGVQIAFAHARKVLQTGAWEISQAPGDYRVSSLPPRDI
jgi:chaperonin GroEL